MSTLDSFALEIAFQFIRKYNPQTLCDYGYGSGDLLCKIAKLFPNIVLYGIEKNKTASYSSEKNSIIELPRIVGAKSKFEKNTPKFDFIISTFSFHHFESPGKELSKISSFLMPSGNLLIVDLIESSNMELAQNKILIDALTELINFHAGIIHRRPYSSELLMDLLTPLPLRLKEEVIQIFYFTEEEKKQYVHHNTLHYKNLLTELSSSSTPYKEIIQTLINLYQEFSFSEHMYNTSAGAFLFKKY